MSRSEMRTSAAVVAPSWETRRKQTCFVNTAIRIGKEQLWADTEGVSYRAVRFGSTQEARPDVAPGCARKISPPWPHVPSGVCPAVRCAWLPFVAGPFRLDCARICCRGRRPPFVVPPGFAAAPTLKGTGRRTGGPPLLSVDQFPLGGVLHAQLLIARVPLHSGRDSATAPWSPKRGLVGGPIEADSAACFRWLSRDVWSPLPILRSDKHRRHRGQVVPSFWAWMLGRPSDRNSRCVPPSFLYSRERFHWKCRRGADRRPFA